MSDRQQVHEQLEAELAFLWRRVRRLSIDLARQVDDGLEAAAYGLLGLLADGGDVRAADLAEKLGLDKSTVSRQVTQMESIGLIQRVPDPQDGRARVQQLRAARGRWFGEALEDWPAADVDTLAVLLKHLNESLSQE